MKQNSIDSPKKSWSRHRLVHNPTHCCADSLVGPDGFEEFLCPARIDFNVIIKEQEVFVRSVLNGEVALHCRIRHLMEVVANIYASCLPAPIVSDCWCFTIFSAMNDYDLGNRDGLF
jgi:hypothetical protein